MPTDPAGGPEPFFRRRGNWIGAAALSCMSLLATAPGLGGGFIHDDVNMVGNPHYENADDIARVFVRHSGDYAPTVGDRDGAATSQTYRPVTMLTLVSTHVMSPWPLAHHLLGWALHALTAWLLWLALRRSDPRAEARAAHAALAGLFLLHPIGVEAYVWINGRSDLVAGLCLSGLLCTLASSQRSGVANALAVFALVLLGSASKETFAPAALLATVAFGLGKRSLRVLSIPAIAGVAAYALARLAVLPPTAATIAGSESPFASAAGWLFLPKLGAIASHALLSLRAANMQSMCWDFVRSLSAAEWICGALAMLGVSALAVARDLRGLGFAAGAVACVVPTIMVVVAIWLGLDRYLYMPLLLVLFAAAPYLTRGWIAVVERRPRLVPLAAAAVLALAAFDTRVASHAYESQQSWLATLLEERPEDPSVVVFVAQELGQPAARAILQHLPPPPWPRAVIVPAVAIANSGGQRELANSVAEYGVREYPQDALIVAVALRQRYEAGQRQAALALVPTISRGSPICREVRRQLEIWGAHKGSADSEQVRAAAAGLRCDR